MELKEALNSEKDWIRFINKATCYGYLDIKGSPKSYPCIATYKSGEDRVTFTYP